MRQTRKNSSQPIEDSLIAGTDNIHSGLPSTIYPARDAQIHVPGLALDNNRNLSSGGMSRGQSSRTGGGVLSRKISANRRKNISNANTVTQQASQYMGSQDHQVSSALNMMNVEESDYRKTIPAKATKIPVLSSYMNSFPRNDNVGAPKSAANAMSTAQNSLGLKFDGKSRSGLRIPIPAGAVQVETKLPELKYINEGPKMRREKSAVTSTGKNNLPGKRILEKIRNSHQVRAGSAVGSALSHVRSSRQLNEQKRLSSRQMGSRTSLDIDANPASQMPDPRYQFLANVGGPEARTLAFIRNPSGDLPSGRFGKPGGNLKQQFASKFSQQEGQASFRDKVKVYTDLNVDRPVKAFRGIDKDGAHEMRGYVIQSLNQTIAEPGERVRRQPIVRLQVEPSPRVSSRSPTKSLTQSARKLHKSPTRRSIESTAREPLATIGTDRPSKISSRMSKRASSRGGIAAAANLDEMPVAMGPTPRLDDLQGMSIPRADAPMLRARSDIVDTLPYPELFDRSERTFAATFAKFRDLSYFTPVQRIGVYMDYSQRLRRHHLLDLIEYMKVTTAVSTRTPEEDAAMTDEALQEYLQHCIYVGLMPLEDKPGQYDIDDEDPDASYDFPAFPLDEQGLFNYGKVWSEELVRQVELSAHRFLNYVESPDTIKNHEIQQFKKEWMQRALELIPPRLLQAYPGILREQFQDVFSSYMRAMREAVLLYILRSPEERKRLHILVLPGVRKTSSERAARLGGYSVRKYGGHNKAMVAASLELRENLLVNNIVQSSLQSWWQEFAHFDLVLLRNLGQFVIEKNPGVPGSAVYGMEVDQFLRLQSIYLGKVASLLHNIWHRGAIMIIKKFKYLRTHEHEKWQRDQSEGVRARGKWTFCGFRTGGHEQPSRRFIEDSEWRRIYAFEDEEANPYLKLCMRTGSFHQNIHRTCFLDEPGLQSSDMFEARELQEHVKWQDLADIRDSVAYKAYQALTGDKDHPSTIPLQEETHTKSPGKVPKAREQVSPYKMLSKEYRRELKRIGGRLMEHQLREVVDRSARTLRNFFTGFMPFGALKLHFRKDFQRKVRPAPTEYAVAEGRVYSMTRQEELDQEERLEDPKRLHEMNERNAERLKIRAKRLGVKPAEVLLIQEEEMKSKDPPLSVPDFIDFQDYVNPIFRIELSLRPDPATTHYFIQSAPAPLTIEKRQQIFDLEAATNPAEPYTVPSELDFSLKKEDIIDSFGKFFDRTVNALRHSVQMLKPEYAKVKEVTPEEMKREFDEIRKVRQLMRNQGNKHDHHHQNHEGKTAPRIVHGQGQKGNVIEVMIGQMKSSAQSASVVQDFEGLLYPDMIIGVDVYRKFMGLMQVHEKVKVSESKKKKNNEDMQENRFLRTADHLEPRYVEMRKEIVKSVRQGLDDTDRVIEMFDDFKPVIDGSLRHRVVNLCRKFKTQPPPDPDAFIAGRRGKQTGAPRITNDDFTALLGDLRRYQRLARLLPAVVFLPMFEVGVLQVKEQIQQRLVYLVEFVFSTYEDLIIEKTRQLNQQYEKICLELGKPINSPLDFYQMEKFKGDLIHQLIRIREQGRLNRESLFFVINNDHICSEELIHLTATLHAWPAKLEEVQDKEEERHEVQRVELEKWIGNKRVDFDNALKVVAAAVKSAMDEAVSKWSQGSITHKLIEIVRVHKATIDEKDKQLTEILEQERLVLGVQGSQKAMNELKAWFSPFYEMWEIVHEAKVKKAEWFTARLADINPDAVDILIKESSQAAVRLERELYDIYKPALHVIKTLRQDLADLKEELPLIEVVCSNALRDRHWDQIKVIMGTVVGAETLRIRDLKQSNVKSHLHQLVEINERAKREVRLERMLAKMEREWDGKLLELTQFRETGIPILQGANVEEHQMKLDEHRLLAQTICTSAEVVILKQQSAAWEKRLTSVQDALETWVRVQANYLYLAPVMESEDIKGTLPSEARAFSEVQVVWHDVTATVGDGKPVLELTDGNDILNQLGRADKALEIIVHRLSVYLELKRESFPRFFFLSNSEMLEILGESRNPERVQPHLKKCFEGIKRVNFDAIGGGLAITQLISPEGETADLITQVEPASFKNNVEQWLSELERQMRNAVQSFTERCILSRQDSRRNPEQRRKWRLNWQSQAILAASIQSWTHAIESALSSADPKAGLAKCYESDQMELAEIVQLVREPLSSLDRSTLGALITLSVHGRDVLAELIAKGTSSIRDFDWLAQLRHYFNKEDRQLTVVMVKTRLNYAHEYLGNTGRLVMTPLTDRCYMTLMSAIELNLGGAPEGPAGTGKTETTKDLAKTLAAHCLVFNCADGLDVLAMAKFFKGLASAGSWSCFDEFNRIDIEVLSVIAQQILEIQTAKNQGKTKFHFEGSELTLKQECNIFITMNPGYAGRADLPDNLKALFRPVAMMVPDYAMIGEISLYSFGFVDSRTLAEKIVATFRLCSEQLSSQFHYDYGMRAVKTTLSAAKVLKQDEPDENEVKLIIRSLISVNLPKFLQDDVVLFYSVLQGLFPTSDIKAEYEEELKNFICSASRRFKLQATDQFVEKVLQFRETVRGRHGVMLVGPPASAKTTVYRVLAKALTLQYDHIFQSKSSEEYQTPEKKEIVEEEDELGLKNKAEKITDWSTPVVELHVINPRSLEMHELYGSFDAISHDFTDGVLGTVYRACASEDRESRLQWIVFDGPVDADWIENLNTVLDDNKKLCLLNGEVIPMTDSMRLVVEADDLSYASPATVSRCGMVYLEPAMLGASTMFESWLERITPDLSSEDGAAIDPAFIVRLRDLFKVLFMAASEYVLDNCRLIIPQVSQVQLAASMFKILSSILTEPAFLYDCHDEKAKLHNILQKLDLHFLYALIWSVGAITDELGQKMFSTWLRDWMKSVHSIGDLTFKIEASNAIPETAGANVHDFFVDTHRWTHWKEKLPRSAGAGEPESTVNEAYETLWIQTTESLKLGALLQMGADHGLSILLIGPSGTGKTGTVRQFLKDAPREERSFVDVTFSAKTRAQQLSDILVKHLEKRGRKTLGPGPGKRCSVFVDDLSMPTPGKYGAQVAIELLRQLIDHGSWYDQTEKGRPLQSVVDVDYIAAMAPPSGGRSSVSPRLLRHFNVISIPNFGAQVLERIFQTIMDNHLRRISAFGGVVGQTFRAAVSASIQVLIFAQRDLKPTPSKSHYLFSMREVDRIVQGLSRIGLQELQGETKKVVRLWAHETARVFGDRLTNNFDVQLLYDQMKLSVREKMREDLLQAIAPVLGRDVREGASVLQEGLMFSDVVAGRAYLDEVLPETRPKLRTLLERQLEDHNALASKMPISIVVFEQALLHVHRITRILQMQRKGHALLIGLQGTGRQSLSRLAAALCAHALEEVTINRGGSPEEQWREGLKHTLVLAGQDGRACTLLISDTKLQAGSFLLEDLNNLLNSDCVPNLFAADDWMQIEERLRAVAKRNGMQDLHDTGTKAELEDYFVKRTSQNLHVVVTMSPVGPALRERIRDFPALVTCTSIDWLGRWPSEALEAVCVKILEESDFEKKALSKVAKACRIIHAGAIKLSEQFLENQKRHVYVTPSSYLELLKVYKMLLAAQRDRVQKERLGYERGVEKLLFSADQVEKMKIDLSEKGPKLQEMSAEADRLLEQIQKESAEVVEPRQAQMQLEEQAANAIAMEAEAIKKECDANLAEALPVLKKAQDALKTIRPEHVNEIKHLHKPPSLIRKVLHSICVMMEKPPERVLRKDKPGEYEDDWWLAAQKMMSERDFLKNLLDYDTENIPEKVMKKIRDKFVPDPEFQPARVAQAGFAAKGLCQWVLALDQYERINKIVAPKRLRAAEAEAKYQETLLRLQAKQAELREVMATFESLQARLGETRSRRAQLEEDIAECEMKIQRAKALLDGLGGEQSRWESAIVDLTNQQTALVGDCLLAAASIVYLAPYTGEYRNNQNQYWLEALRSLGVPVQHNFDFIKLLGEQVVLRQWALQGLPKSNFSISSALMATKGRRWPLMIDPQGTASRWIRRLELGAPASEGRKAKPGLVTVRPGDSDFMRKFENAIPLGLPVLLEGVGLELDTVLHPLLDKRLKKVGGSLTVDFGDAALDYNPDFRLYMTTKLANPHLLPEVSTLVTVVNFVITFTGLRDQLVDQIVLKENSALDEQQQAIIQVQYEQRRAQHDVEEQILRVLRESEGNILDDEKAIEALAKSQELANEIKAKQEISSITLAKLTEARGAYEPAAAHCSLLFFIVQKLSVLDVMYQYSLQWFIALFNCSLDGFRAEALARRRDQVEADEVAFYKAQEEEAHAIDAERSHADTSHIEDGSKSARSHLNASHLSARDSGQPVKTAQARRLQMTLREQEFKQRNQEYLDPANISIDEVQDHFLNSLYQNVSRSLFEKDKLIFALLLAIKSKQAKGLLSAEDYLLMTQSNSALAVVGSSSQPGSVPSSRPITKGSQRSVVSARSRAEPDMENPTDWLPANIWKELLMLAKRSKQVMALLRTFGTNPKWRIIYKSENPMREEFPPILGHDSEGNQTETHISSLVKLAMVKAMSPGKFMPAARELVAIEMGETYLNPPLFDIDKSFEDSTSVTPLIFVLPAADPLQSLTSFARRKKRLESLKTVSLGQGQGVRAEKLIADARKTGGWVLLQNCHLYPSWMPALESITEQLSLSAQATGLEASETVHPSFRLWLSSYPSECLPSLVLRNSIKMTNEPPRGLKANMLRSYMSTRSMQDSLALMVGKAEMAQRLIYSLCMFHAIVEGRKQFGTIGWNVTYAFSTPDLVISIQQLLHFFYSSESVPAAVAAVRQLAASSNYGGRLTDARDRRVLMALLDDFCQLQPVQDLAREKVDRSEAIVLDFGSSALPPTNAERDAAAFSLEPGVFIYKDVLVRIKDLPTEQPPGLFGFHEGALIAMNRKEMRQVCSQLQKMGEVHGLAEEEVIIDPVEDSDEDEVLMEQISQSQAQKSGDQSVHMEPDQLQVMNVCQQILKSLPDETFFNVKALKQRFPVSIMQPFNSVLVQEVQRFRPLVMLIRDTSAGLVQVMKGEKVASAETEALYESLKLGELPAAWARRSYPTMRNLANYIGDLSKRLRALEDWIKHEHQPRVFWMPGFFFPQAFLTAVLQVHATACSVPINTLGLDFRYTTHQVMAVDEGMEDMLDPYILVPSEKGGVHISGLYLEGASWSPREAVLEESHPDQTCCKMPVITLIPIDLQEKARKKRKGANTEVDLHSSIFECPLYRSPARFGTLMTTGHSTNFVMYFDMRCDAQTTAKHWIKRGVALLCEPPE